MLVVFGYLSGAVLVALGVYVASDLAARRNRRGPARPALTAVAAGLLWPIVVAGVTQFALLFTVSRILRWFVGLPTSCVPAGGVSQSVVSDSPSVRTA